jgi:hypothetical protein
MAIRIEDLLVEVDRWCGFTRELVPLPLPATDGAAYTALLAALVAHATNPGSRTRSPAMWSPTRWVRSSDTCGCAASSLGRARVRCGRDAGVPRGRLAAAILGEDEQARRRR